MPQAELKPDLAFEVPLTGDASPSAALAPPEVAVPPLGPPAFQLAALPPGAARAGRSSDSPGASPSRCLVWRLDGAAPSTLALQEVAVNEERRDGAVRLAFAAPLLPAVACTEVAGGGGGAKTRVAAITADGALHTVLCSPGGEGGLPRQLAAPGAVASVPLAPLFQRAGTPTALLEAGGHLCVGTADGNLVCVPAGSTDPGTAFQLAPAGGLTKVLLAAGTAGRAGAAE